MLPEKRRRKPNRGRCGRKLEWKAGHTDSSCRGMFNFNEHFSMQDLGSTKNLIYRVNWGAWDTGLGQEFDPSGGVALEKNSCQDMDQLFSVLNTLRVFNEPGIIGQL